MELIKSVSEQEFRKNVRIYFNNILTGFEIYDNKILTPSSENFIDSENAYVDFIKKSFELNDKRVYIDFYINRLNKEAIENINKNLDDNEKKYFEKIRTIEIKSDYFLITNEEMLSLFVKLCTRELFFITFYFQKYHLTIWGNYNLNFPIFYENNNDFNYYKEILLNCNIKFKSN